MAKHRPRSGQAKPWLRYGRVKPKHEEPQVRVIRDPRDATKDYFIPRAEAVEAYRKGWLAFDITNHAYTEQRS
jgi:hypothetical protein